MKTINHSTQTLAEQISAAYKQAHPHNTSNIIESLHLIRRQRSERRLHQEYVSDYYNNVRDTTLAAFFIVSFIFVYRFLNTELDALRVIDAIFISTAVSTLFTVFLFMLLEALQALLPMQTVLGFLHRRGIVNKVTEAQHIVECHDREYTLIIGAMEDAVRTDIQKTYGVRWVITPYGYKVTNVNGTKIWRASDVHRVIDRVQDNITVIHNGHYRSVQYATIEGEHVSLRL